MLSHLRQEAVVALDTESDSLYSYHVKVCLIQITAHDPHAVNGASVVDYLVDPLRLRDLSALGELFSSGDREVVMHAAENDMLLLYRSMGFTFSHVFDTQLAARILGWKQVGLAAILEEQFGIATDKRMQRTNWGKRPLTPEQIAYAQIDTHYLPPLRDRLIDELRGMGRWEEALDAFRQLSAVDYAQRPFEERTFWHMKAARTVSSGRSNVLEALWLWREEMARTQDRPPFKVVGDSVLLDVAEMMPDTTDDLRKIKGLSENQIRRYGGNLVDVAHEGLRQPQPVPPSTGQRHETTLEDATLRRYDVLRKWRSDKARARAVSPDIVLTNSTILEIAQRNPRTADELRMIPEIGRWKAKHYGPEILAAIAHTQSGNGRG